MTTGVMIGAGGVVFQVAVSEGDMIHIAYENLIDALKVLAVGPNRLATTFAKAHIMRGVFPSKTLCQPLLALLKICPFYPDGV